MFVNSSTIGPLGTYPYYMLAALFFAGSVILFRHCQQWPLKKCTMPVAGNPNGLPLSPGPKSYPLIGSLFDMPIDKPWVVFDDWRKTYGKTLPVAVAINS